VRSPSFLYLVESGVAIAGRTDVRALCAKVRADRGAAADPVAAHRASGYVERVSAERGATAGVAGGWGR